MSAAIREMLPLLWPYVMVLLTGGMVMTLVPGMVMVERWGSAWMQRRVGPNRVGPFGTLQAVADAVKMIFKEDNLPQQAHKVLYVLAPALAILPPIFAFSVIPLAGTFVWGGQEYSVSVANLSVSLLFVLAISSLHVYSVLTGGWASNNKFSLMGGLRASSQMISYEIAMGVTVVSMVMTYGTLDLREIAKLQEAGSAFPAWGIFLQPLALLIFWICAFAECNRLPFDLPEGESELVAGYHTEYSGLKFALYMLGEYAAMMLASSMLATLFLGGYNVPFVSQEMLRNFWAGHGLNAEWASIVTVLCQFAAFMAKMLFFMWVFVWVRWTLPRFRYDQLMNLGWKVLLPLGIVNMLATMGVSYWLIHGGTLP